VGHTTTKISLSKHAERTYHAHLSKVWNEGEEQKWGQALSLQAMWSFAEGQKVVSRRTSDTRKVKDET